MRGPFEGTWQQGIRPTVVTAPDCLVYINGESDVIGCASCQRRFDFNKYITSVQVDLHVDSCPGSASINMSIPRHSVDEFFFDGNPMITPMMEVEIFAKGYFLVEGLPQYYPIFWGLVTEVSDNYSAGEHTFSINCADILKWWELCKMNITPAFGVTGQLGSSIYGNVLFGSNPYDMIWTLAQQSFGDVVAGSGSLVTLVKEATQRQTFNAALADMMAYWQQRFSKIRSNLMLYGTQGNAVRGDLLYQSYQKQGGGKKFKNSKAVPFASQAVRQANGGAEASQMVFDPTAAEVTAFRTQFNQAGQVNFWQSEFQTKLEIANACKEAIGFEFYMDVTGDIVFKPPFYNLDILSNKPISWIQDIDIIDWDLSESEAEVVTQIQISGSFGGNVDYGLGEEITPHTSVTDYHLLRQYGWRTQTMNSEFSGNLLQMFYIGLDMLDRYNSRRYRGSVSIPLRPELRLGFPIYLAPKDQVWYVSGISHNIQFGGRAQTTLTLTAKRKKFIAPTGIGSIKMTSGAGPNGVTTQQLAKSGQFTAKIGDAAQIPPINTPTTTSATSPYEPLIIRDPKTGRVLGYPNVVMAYTKPFANPADADFAKAAGRKDPTATRVPPQTRKQNDKLAAADVQKYSTEGLTASSDDTLREKYLNNRHSYGLNSAGVYTYLYDQSAVMKEIVLLPVKNIQFDAATNKLQIDGKTAMIRPVSDERGFEVIGHFRYGRGVSLTDGSLVLSSGGNNTPATISFQLAATGGLTSMLQSQSQGITTSTGISSNPAQTLASLTPDDLQSAAAINPDTHQPQYVTAAANFVSTAPLGSPQQKGGTNSTSTAAVEASQLSRALTLAEMAALQEVIPEDQCDCLLGRADLSFISEGYQISVVGSSTPAVSGSAAADASRQQASALQNQQNAFVTAATAGAPPDQVTSIALDAISQFQQQNIDQINALEAATTSNFLNEPSAASTPVVDMVMQHSEVVGKVESFLVGLYTALDASHQQYEAGLRGDFVSTPTRNPQDVRFGTPSDLPPISPPFDLSGRAAAGDPVAAGQAAVAALNDAAGQASNFGQALQAPAQRAQLQQQIADLQTQITSMEADVQAARDSGQQPDPNETAALDKAGQQLANLQQQLSQLNASFPA